MICATDPVLATVGLTAQDIERITSMPWHVNAQQVVDGKQCLVLEIDGHRVRLLTRGDESSRRPASQRAASGWPTPIQRLERTHGR
eukprot:jgi/Tetstr1/453920/TSEL_040839.t1